MAALAVAGWTLTACNSPEATRTRGAGPGSDVQNRRDEVHLHGGAEPYWRTPRIIPPPPGSGERPVRVSRSRER
ncbi:MAG TPA: hypothetical protein VJU81_18265 [Methylomirabilota bacterium]|nr:hypothetical protein [Methylomirabilota bacterium]